MFDVNMLLTSFGLIGILGIIFMETGLLIGFIFPGDTLLFTAGIMAHANPPFTPLWTLLVGIPIAAGLGDQLGFFIGRSHRDAGTCCWCRADGYSRGGRHFAHAVQEVHAVFGPR